MRGCSRWLCLSTTLLLAAACGGRSELSGARGEGAAGSAASCTLDSDCAPPDACSVATCSAGRCEVALRACPDDGDACTEERCEPALGCVHAPLTLDRDGDGVRGPRPGFAPGAPGACGEDCDDDNALAFPGNVESAGCDGVDNDCNGVIDDGARYSAALAGPLRVSTADDVRATRGAIVATADGFLFTYTGTRRAPSGGERSVGLLEGVDVSGNVRFQNPVSELNSDSYGAALAWSGDGVAASWSDARQGGRYEVYFNRFTTNGAKLGADLRITNARGFSLDPDLLWTGAEYLLAWSDRREESAVVGDAVRIFGQRVLPDGALRGGNELLVGDEPIAENPVLARGLTRIGLAYTTLDAALESRLGFRSFALEPDATPAARDSTPLGAQVHSPGLYFVADRFIALWSTRGENWGESLWGAAFSERGELLVAPRPVTAGAKFARSHAAISLGDRLLVLWADDRAGHYDVYWQVLDRELRELVARQRLTTSATNSVAPAAAIGPGGRIAVLFDDWLDGSEQVYFTTLTCDTAR